MRIVSLRGNLGTGGMENNLIKVFARKTDWIRPVPINAQARLLLDHWAMGQQNEFVFYNRETGKRFVDLKAGSLWRAERPESKTQQSKPTVSQIGRQFTETARTKNGGVGQRLKPAILKTSLLGLRRTEKRLLIEP